MGRAASARAPGASGRFAWVLLLAGGCAVAQSDGGSPAPAVAPPDPVVAPGPISLARQAEAAQLFALAEEALAAGRPLEAAQLADTVVSRFPASGVSGSALLLQARAWSVAGVPLQADSAGERYVGLLDPGDARVGEVRLLQAEALDQDPEARLDRLLRMGPGARPNDVARALRMARSAADSLDLSALEGLLEAAPARAEFLPVAEARYAAQLLLSGNPEEASEAARLALASGAVGRDSLIAEGVLRGEIPDGVRRVTVVEIATVLPLTGPPALADFAARIAEGVEVAAATVLGGRFDVRVRALDDRGDPTVGAELVSELEGEGVAGVVGFLMDDALAAAGQARIAGVTIVSPTARSASEAGAGVYSLAGPDPQAAAAMARFSASQGYSRVAIVHSRAPESVEEADVFQAVVESLGIPVVGRYGYDVGATFFEQQIIAARNALRRDEIAALGLTEDDTLRVEMLEPVALFLPLPAEDVEFVAPQVTHYGLDTLAIDVMGTTGWTDAQTLATVDRRHTDGVYATAPVGSGPGSAGYQRFLTAYEEYFQQSVASPVPAVGYDAALLMLEALKSGRSAPGAVRSSMEQLSEVEGATGVYSVIGDRIVRRTEVVRIGQSTWVPVG